MKQICCVLALLLCLTSSPARQVYANIPAVDIGSKIESAWEGIVFDTPNDIDIWEDGASIYIKHGYLQRKLTPSSGIYKMRDYLVTIETYQDSDGEQVTVIYFYITLSTGTDFAFGDVHTQGSATFRDVCLYSTNSRYNSNNSMVYYLTIKGSDVSEFTHARTVFSTSGISGLKPAEYGDLKSEDDYSLRSGYIQPTAFLQNKYRIYCSRPVHDGTEDGEILCPTTPLPAASRTGGTMGDLPYQTTFRMLTDGATTYNTFYYTSCYLSSADEISASGKVRLDTTKLADGTVTRGVLDAPQLLCQISSYGTVYDIVDTNDENLCDLLGIDIPTRRYWDVEAQQWKDKYPVVLPDDKPTPTPAGGNGGNSGGDDWSGSADEKSFLDILKNALGRVTSFVGAILSSLVGLISKFAHVGTALAELFPFLPDDLIAFITISIQAGLVIGIYRLIRG